MKSTILYIAGTAPTPELLKALGYRAELVAFRNAQYFNPADLEEFEKGAKGTVVLDEPKGGLAQAESITEAYKDAKVKVVTLASYLKGKPEETEAAPFNPDAKLPK